MRFLLLFIAGVASGASPQTPQPFRISVDVDLVALQATVHDRKGRFAGDLREQDFAVFEDGVRQTVTLFRHEDVPVTVGLVIDHSGSMRHKLADVVLAARTFVRASNPEDQMFVVNFNEKVTFGLPDATAFTNRSDDLEAAILNAPATGQTALYDAVLQAQERLQAGSRDRKVLIVISDGGDNASAHKLAEVLKIAGQSGALIYTIGIFDEDEQDRNPDVLRRLARTTGGEAFFPRQLNEVVAICEQIAHEIRSQYTIGYASANSSQSNSGKSSAWRAIRVTAHAEGKSDLVVRTRTGYFPKGGLK
jgi:VWFA-related protein